MISVLAYVSGQNTHRDDRSVYVFFFPERIGRFMFISLIQEYKSSFIFGLFQ